MSSLLVRHPSRVLSAAVNPEKPVLAVLGRKPAARVPIWLMRQAGRYLPEYQAVRGRAGSFLNLCLTPELAAEVTLQPIHRFGMDAAILFADILLVCYGLGQDLDYREGEGPSLRPRLANASDLARLVRANATARLAPVYDTVRQVRAAMPPACTLIGFAGAPWTVASYMIEGASPGDCTNAKRWAYADPDGFQSLIDLLVDTTSDYLAAQIEAGAEAIQLFDSWAGALAEPEFARWCVAPVKRLVVRLRDQHPAVPVIAFPRGAGLGYRAVAAGTGVDALSLDPTVPVEWAAQALQPQVALQGNLDPQLVVVGGRAMADRARELLAGFGGGPYIFNLGHGVVPDTPLAHVSALVDLVKSWPAAAR